LQPQCLQKRSAGLSRFAPHWAQNLAPVSVVATQQQQQQEQHIKKRREVTNAVQQTHIQLEGINRFN
jgi:hypothetical protein